MKQIIFDTAPAFKHYTGRELVMQTIKQFLIKHGGMSDSTASEYVVNGNWESEIDFTLSCANRQFTRALALFQLLFCDKTEIGGYIRYTPSGFTLVREAFTSWEKINDHIISHMNIKIE